MTYTEIYFKSWCPYSRRALALLTSKGVDFNAIDLTDDDADELEQQMRERSGRTSVPQIFIDGRHIGGYDDIAALEERAETPTFAPGDVLIEEAVPIQSIFLIKSGAVEVSRMDREDTVG